MTEATLALSPEEELTQADQRAIGQFGSELYHEVASDRNKRLGVMRALSMIFVDCALHDPDPQSVICCLIDDLNGDIQRLLTLTQEPAPAHC